MSKHQNTKRNARARLTLAILAATGSIAWASFQVLQTRPLQGRLVSGRRAGTSHSPSLIKTDDGRQLLWASGPRDAATGEWFDVTDSPLDPDGYQFGIGKDSIPAIDQPAFVAINERERLHEHGIDDATVVIGYAHNGASKAYPISIMNRHELVNDQIGGKPVTVGW